MNNRIVLWILIGLTYAIVLVALVLAMHRTGWIYFANVSPHFLNIDPSVKWLGYDGQFAYYIARDPQWAIPHLDSPAHRFQRIVYPMLARAFALGQPDWVPFTMVLVNILAVGLGTGAFAELMRRENAPAWTPLLFFAWFGIGQALLWDLNEITAVAVALCACVYFQQRRMWTASVLFGVAVLAKDIAFLLSVPALVSLLIKREWRAALKIGGLGLAPYFVWMGIMRLSLGMWNFAAADLPSTVSVCNEEGTSVFIALVIVPVLIVILTSWKHWDRFYFLATIIGFLFYGFLLGAGHCGHVLFRWGTPLVISTVLLLAYQRRRTWLIAYVAVWSATFVITLLLAIYQ